MNFERGRWWAPDLTVDQVREICLNCQNAGMAKSGLGAEMRPPFSEKLTGKTFTMRFGDFKDLTYKFNGTEELEWSEDGVSFKKEYCQTMELDEGSNLIYTHHLRAYTFPVESFIFVIDLNNGLVTLVHSNMGGFYRPREVGREFHFGYIVKEGAEPPKETHGFTKEMEDLYIDWHYDKKNAAVARHIYVDHKHKFDRIIINGVTINCTGMICDYVKIREKIYIMSWVETNTQGIQGCALMNLSDKNNYHDIGSFFGINRRGSFESYAFGAVGVHQDHI